MDQTKEIENKINELAAKVIPTNQLESFNKLPLKERVFGIKFIANITNEKEIIRLCEHAEKLI